MGHASADEAGVASLRHDGHAGLGADSDHEGHLRRVARARHRDGRASEQAACIDEMPFEIDGLHENVGGAEPLGERRDQGRGRSGVDRHASCLSR